MSTTLFFLVPIAMLAQSGVDGAPEFPFQGRIQSVALYSTALSTTALQSHFFGGAGG